MVWLVIDIHGIKHKLANQLVGENDVGVEDRDVDRQRLQLRATCLGECEEHVVVKDARCRPLVNRRVLRAVPNLDRHHRVTRAV